MTIEFNEIFIIESLPSNDRQTGSELYTHLSTPGVLPIPVSLHRPKTATELFSVLDAAALRAQTGGWIPLIHFEMHGAATGNALVTASGHSIPWDNVAAPLGHLNIAVRNSLLVVLGVCSGARIAIAAANSPFERAPFCGIVGPDKTVIDFFLPLGFKAFYDELIRSGDLAKSILQLRQYTLPEYIFFDVAMLFRRGLEVYEDTQTQGSRLHERVKKIFKKARKELVAVYGSNNRARAEIARRIKDTTVRKKKYYDHFIMADLYPENTRRFPPADSA